jgi:hypothetical protein
MSDTQIIAAQLTANMDDAVKNVLKLKGTVADLRKEFKNAQAGSDEQVAALKKLQTAEADLAKAQNQLNNANKGTSEHFAKIKEGLGQLPGAAGEAGEGVSKLHAKFNALLANPIVLIITAIVAALALLYKAFTNTFEGAEKVEQIFAGVKAAAQSLLDNLGKIGSAIVKFFTFDFSGAVKEIKGVAQSAADAFNAMAKLTKQAQELHREQLANDLDQAERQKKLAILREQSTDETVPLAERKKALLELREEAEKNAKEDIDLAKRTAENKIAQLTLEKDGARKNQDEINKIKIEQINVETENANELRRINKQITAAEKQELAERKEAARKAAEEAKKAREQLIEFTNKLTKLEQENELATIKDSYQKELKALQNRIDDEKRANQVAFQEKKITRDQLNQLNAALDIQANLQRDAITDKHNKEVEKKEADFQKELNGILAKTKLDGVIDTRKNELLQLEIGYQEKLAQAIEHYKDDSAKLEAIKKALEEQYRADRQKAEDKFKKEDEKKAFELEEQRLKGVIDKKNFDFDLKQQAVDQEQALVQKAFDDKVITEQEYNTKIAALAEARKNIRDQERAHNQAVGNAIASTFGTIAEIAGKQTVLGKALSIAQTTIQTYQSAVGAYRGMVTTIPGPIGITLGIAAAAGALKTGLDAVKKIIATKIPGTADAGGSAPTALVTPAAPVAPTQTSTQIDQQSINDIGNAAAGGVNAVRAYVVESDSSNAANRAARLAGAAVLGH